MKLEKRAFYCQRPREGAPGEVGRVGDDGGGGGQVVRGGHGEQGQAGQGQVPQQRLGHCPCYRQPRRTTPG